jgi:hypothetical protein
MPAVVANGIIISEWNSAMTRRSHVSTESPSDRHFTRLGLERSGLVVSLANTQSRRRTDVSTGSARCRGSNLASSSFTVSSQSHTTCTVLTRSSLLSWSRVLPMTAQVYRWSIQLAVSQLLTVRVFKSNLSMTILYQRLLPRSQSGSTSEVSRNLSNRRVSTISGDKCIHRRTQPWFTSCFWRRNTTRIPWFSSRIR